MGYYLTTVSRISSCWTTTAMILQNILQTLAAVYWEAQIPPGWGPGCQSWGWTRSKCSQLLLGPKSELPPGCTCWKGGSVKNSSEASKKKKKKTQKKHSHSLILGAVQQDHRTLDPLQGYVRFRVWVAVHSVQGHHTLHVPAHKAAATHTPFHGNASSRPSPLNFRV